MWEPNDLFLSGLTSHTFWSSFFHLFRLLFSHKSPRLNGKHLTTAEKLLPLIHWKASATLCSAAAPQCYYFAAEWNAI